MLNTVISFSGGVLQAGFDAIIDGFGSLKTFIDSFDISGLVDVLETLQGIKEFATGGFLITGLEAAGVIGGDDEGGGGTTTISISATLPQETLDELGALGLAITQALADGMITPESQMLMNQAIASLLSGAVSSVTGDTGPGASDEVTSGTDTFGIAIINQLATTLASNADGPAITTAGLVFATGVKRAIKNGLGDMGAWTKLEVVDPMVTAIKNGMREFRRAINDGIPDEVDVTVTMDVPMVGPVDFPTKLVLPPNPLKLALGGSIAAGQIAQINENGLPFEIFNVGGKQFFLPGQGGNIQSPLGKGANGISGLGSTVDNSIHVSISGNESFTLEQAESSMKQIIEQTELFNQPDRQLRLEGKI